MTIYNERIKILNLFRENNWNTAIYLYLNHLKQNGEIVSHKYIAETGLLIEFKNGSMWYWYG